MTVRVVVLDAAQEQWLVDTSGRLPAFETETEALSAKVTSLVREARGVEGRLLFCPWRTAEERIVVLEPVGELPNDLCWSNELSALSEAEQGAVCAARTPEPRRVPWAKPGWFEEMQAWLAGSLTEPIQHMELVRTWSLSCVWRVLTAERTVYFKATNLLPLFCNEPLVTLRLAEVFPSTVPCPLALDPERGWMVLADFGPTLSECPERGGSTVAVRQMGQLQRVCLGQDEQLLAWGVVDRRAEHLAAQLPELWDDPMCVGELSEEECHALRNLPWDRWLAWWATLPNSLVHGDPHTGNMAPTDTGVLIFDWSDACVAPPWVDLLDLLFEEDASVRATSAEAHAEALGLRVPWHAVAPLVALHHVVSYRSIAQHTEPRVGHEHGGILPFLLRKVLAMQKDTPQP